MHWEVWITTAKDGDEVVLEGANRFFCRIVSMKIWWHLYQFNVVVCKDFF